MKRLLFLLCMTFFSFFAQAEEESGYMFRLILKDKGDPPYTLNQPSAFLSTKAIDRRVKQGIAMDSTDLPIDPTYLTQIRNLNAEIKATSKWVKTVTVYLSDSTVVEELKRLPFVDSLIYVWKGKPQLPSQRKSEETLSQAQLKASDPNFYGEAYAQIHLHRGELLHAAGFKGEGMTIAVIDGGFNNANRIDGFDQSHILDSKNFTHQYFPSVFDSDASHGTKVLSCMFAYRPGSMVGTAPFADYYLFKTEVADEEFPVEEDYWIAAIEYADSIGVDVVNSSLGYNDFNIPEMNHTWDQLDGQSVLISRAATMASDKGMLVFIAAGNERLKDWKKIGFPADADRVITVGSVNNSNNYMVSSFSSIGPTADNRIKPDLMAIGSNTALITELGLVSTFGSGTSFAVPVLAGLGACLWQALPYLTNKQIMELLKENADRYSRPDIIYGYGIPDVYKAYVGESPGQQPINENPAFLQVDLEAGRLYVNLSTAECLNCKLILFSALGNKILERSSLAESIDISTLKRGVYIVYLEINKHPYIRKFIK